MMRSETVQKIRRMIFTDLIAEVDEMLAESNDAELKELHNALAQDPGSHVLEKLEKLKTTQSVQAQAGKPESSGSAGRPEPKPEKKPAAPQKEMKW